MDLKDVINRLSEINQLITECTEDRERASVGSENSKDKETSDKSYITYASSGIDIDKLLYEHSALIVILSESISKINNVLYRRILKKKYIDKKSAREIAKEINYSYGYTCAIISAAEKELQNILYNMN